MEERSEGKVGRNDQENEPQGKELLQELIEKKRLQNKILQEIIDRINRKGGEVPSEDQQPGKDSGG